MTNPVDSRTLAAIYQAAKDAGWTRAEVTRIVLEMFGHLPEQMTEREGRAVLEHLLPNARRLHPNSN